MDSFVRLLSFNPKTLDTMRRWNVFPGKIMREWLIPCEDFATL